MNAIVYTTLAAAQAIQARIDTALGHPALPRNVGGGIHVPLWSLGPTTWQQIRVHPSGTKWAYPIDGLYEFLTPTERTQIVSLESDWNGTTP